MATCRLNDVNPVAYLAETLDAIINGHPQTQIEELMPWRFRKTSSPNPQAIREALTLSFIIDGLT
ncbi:MULTISPECIES: transposase domain-containing protein [unclassified Mesorhizobium]